jgi:[glutamine synthetase] adenylyltransferase / [glutamine synthetase]-adenylyl-L-tyrosine phosphorylase
MTKSASPERVALRLSRLGFAEPVVAGQLLSSENLGLWDPAANTPPDNAAAVTVAALGRAADPDAALRSLAAVLAGAADAEDLRAHLREDAQLRNRLVAVLGASRTLADDLAREPDSWRVLAGRWDRGLDAAATRLHTAIGADAADPVRGRRGAPASVADAGPQLHRAYRRELLAIAARDLAGELSVDAAMNALSDLAAATLQAALAVAAQEITSTADFALAVIGMGKAGGAELNYVSDVDVLFVAEPIGETSEVDALRAAAALAAAMMRVCRAVAWEVDAALRPEGKAGPLVRTLASHQAYYRRWAATWEFQALLKARPIAGDLALAARYTDAVEPMVWTAGERADFVDDVRKMRRRVVERIPTETRDREIKLGPGGLRDVEFAVQLLQLVHGRGDPSLRLKGTLPALDALRDGGYVGRDDAVSLADAYRFLRSTEHRLQLYQLRRTHLVPEPGPARQLLARAMGYRPDSRGNSQAVWEAEWALHGREVRRLHQKLFYRPLLEAVARVPAAELRLTEAEAERRLAALGFARPHAALGHIQALTAGLSRRSAIQRTLLPVMLEAFSDAADPDAGLLAYRQVSDALGNTHWYLRTLRDEGNVAQRLAYLLGTSRYVAARLIAVPDSLRMLADDEQLRLRSAAELAAVMGETAHRQEDAVAAVAAIRSVRRAELLRIGCADLLALAHPSDVATALTATMDATLQVALDVAMGAVATDRGLDRLPIEFAVIAMGRLGGAELGYGSDADVLFVHQPDPTVSETEASGLANEVAERLRTLLAAPSPDPPVQVDAGLRPEGRNGPLARSVDSYAGYYERWSSVWEAQALLRARPVAGSAELGNAFVKLIDPLRYPRGGISAADVREIRRLKGRIDAERLPHGADPATHTKLGRGGLGDVEWTVQLLQLQHGWRNPSLRTTETIRALHAARDVALIDPATADALQSGWQMAARTRNAIVLVLGKAEDQLPSSGPALVGIGRALGYPASFDPGQLVDDYRRAGRRSRRAVERVFYGTDSTASGAST